MTRYCHANFISAERSVLATSYVVTTTSHVRSLAAAPGLSVPVMVSARSSFVP